MNIFFNDRVNKVTGTSMQIIDEVERFHSSLPGYSPTPLYSLPELASEFGLSGLHLKDEGYRFGLKAFKSLGTSYAIFKLLQKSVGGDLLPEEFISEKGKNIAAKYRFSCASDGNHGRAVAHVSKLLGGSAVIYMPSSTVKARIDAIESENAEVIVVDGDYDLAVRTAASDAEEHGRYIIADTGYEGYTEIPYYIQNGYSTLFREAMAKITENDLEYPDIVLIQSGVGAFAASAASYFNDPDIHPRLVNIEATNTDCILRSAPVRTRAHVTYSVGSTIMAGLNCGTPSVTALPIIRERFNLFISIEDEWAVKAMIKLADQGVVSGESGAAGIAALLAMISGKSDLLENLTGSSRKPVVLAFNTEADTDPQNYTRIVGRPAEMVCKRKL